MSDPLSTYLFAVSEEKSMRKQLEENLSYIQNSLVAHGFPPLGDLFSNELDEVKITIDCLFNVLQQRQKDLNIKVQLQERLQKIESERNMYLQKVEQFMEEKNALNSEAGKAQNKHNQEISKLKKEKEKAVVEREDFRKEITKFMSKESKFWHEIKKKESANDGLKEKLRKALGDRDILYQNHIDAVQNFHSQGHRLLKESADEVFNGFIIQGYDEAQNSLLEEIQELRSALETIQKELHILIEERKEAIMRNSKKIPNINLIETNPQVFEAPFQSVSEDLLGTFLENIQRFKHFMRLTSAVI